MLTREYISPLSGRPYYRNVGLIKVYDRNDRRYSVGEIILERFDEQNFQYIIKPYWNSVDNLPRGLFQGIPGIDMSLRKDRYYRVNITPAFIGMRTPSESREDVMQLMASVGLDYYDRFEWLLRSETKCGDDNLLVERKPEGHRTVRNLKNIDDLKLNPDDTVVINDLSDFHGGNRNIVRDIYYVLQTGAKIFIESENRYLRDTEVKSMLYLLNNMLVGMEKNAMNNRRLGRETAKAAGRYTGRKPIKIDTELLRQVAEEFKNKSIIEKEAMEKLSLRSRSTFYRKLKTVKKQSDVF